MIIGTTLTEHTVRRGDEMNKQITPAEIELARQAFARLAFGVEYNEVAAHDLHNQSQVQKGKK